MTCQIRSIVTVSGKKNCGDKYVVGEELKKNDISFNFFYCEFWSYYHSIITEVLIIKKMENEFCDSGLHI